jgi:signal transduction histidine kinase/ligand-binding sensor domain-containing protein
MGNLKARISLITLVVLHVIAGLTQSPSLTFEHFTHEHGISGPVTRIGQDSLGFIWLGSMDGLYRFDGENFVQYRNNPSDATTIPNNIINDLCVDASNRVWAATNGGLCYYDFSDGLFHHISFDVELETIDRHRVHAVWPADELALWFASKTILHLRNGDGSILSYRLPYEDNLTIKCLYEDKNNHVWIGTNYGLYLFDPARKEFKHHAAATDFTRQINLMATVHPLVPLQGDTLLMGSWYGGVQKVLYENGIIKTFPLNDPIETNPRKHVIKGLYQGRMEQWWVGSYGSGLSVWNNAEGKFTYHFHHDPANPKSLGSDYILDLYVDPSGILWIATDRGLDKVDPLARQFQSVSLPELSGEFSVYQLPGFMMEDEQDPDYLWVCVSGAGLFHFNTENQTFQLYQHNPDDPTSLPDNGVYVMYRDHSNRMWVGTRKGLSLFDPVAQQFSVAPGLVLKQIPGVHSILEDQEKNLWFATHSYGVYRYLSSLDSLIHYQHQPDQSNVLPDNRVFCMMLDDDDLWIGTQNRGLCKLNIPTNTFTYYQNDKSNPLSIPDNGVYELYEDPEGLLWITTENGLASMDRATGSFKTYTTFDGLCNNTVYSIRPDGQGNLWLGTNGGLSRFDPREKLFKNYYVHDGLPSNSISGAMIMKEGVLYFGTTGMINYCKPNMMKMNRRLPPVIITQFKIFDKEYAVQRVRDMIEPIHLTHRENMITFDFAALNYTHSSLNQYAYKLEGFDEQWIYCGHKQSATYTNLNGGTYTFRVKAANNDGVWNEAGTYATLIVHPPYWKTWWFFALLALLALSMLYLAYRIRVRQLMQLQNIRLRISRDLHDDIGSTLSSINMISSMSAQGTKNGEKSTEKFQVISSASRQAMDLMSDIVWSIHPKHDRMEMMIVRMRQYTSEILEAAQIAFTLDLDESAKKVILPIEKRKDFYLIYKEAINNLAKHSQAKNASIKIHFHRDTLDLVIKDDGVGFDPDQNHSGNGVKNMKARASQIKASLTLDSQKGKGTTMKMQIPVT